MIRTKTTMVATGSEDIEILLKSAYSIFKNYRSIKLNCVVIRHYKGLNNDSIREEKLYTIYNEGCIISEFKLLKDRVLDDLRGYYNTKVIFTFHY